MTDALLAAWARIDLPTPEEIRGLARTLDRVADDLERRAT